MSTREERAAEMFRCTARERAAFEAGVKMGAIYHQFVGVPVDMSSVDALERCIEKGVLVQPYVESVRVGIDRSSFRDKADEYSYVSLAGDMLDVELVIRIGDVRARAEMRYNRELNYPLMYVSEISGERAPPLRPGPARRRKGAPGAHPQPAAGTMEPDRHYYRGSAFWA